MAAKSGLGGDTCGTVVDGVGGLQDLICGWVFEDLEFDVRLEWEGQ